MATVRRFRFSLERVLSVRGIALQEARAELAAATGALQEAERRLRRAEAGVGRAEGDLASLRASAALDVAACLQSEAALDRAGSGVLTAADEARRRTEARGRALEAHEAARRGVRGLEELRERRRAEHAQERREAESKTLDEVASRRFPPPERDP